MNKRGVCYAVVGLVVSLAMGVILGGSNPEMIKAATIPSQITDYVPQVVGSTETGSYTNEDGKIVEVKITHPGVGMTQKELDNMRNHVRNGDEPWVTAFNSYASSAKSTINPRIYYNSGDSRYVIVPTIWEDPVSADYIAMRANLDSSTAVNQAIMWYITGNDTYRSNAMFIIRSYSKLQVLVPQKGFRWGIAAYQLSMAAEILRYSNCQTEALKWTEGDTTNFNSFLNITYGNYNQKYFWMNQHEFATMGVFGNAVFRNDYAMYAEAIEQITVNKGGAQGGDNGSLKYQLRYMTINELTGEALDPSEYHVQLIEMGRDAGHAYATLGGLSTLVQSAYIQGTKVDPETGIISTAADAVNLYDFHNDRLLEGANSLIRYHLGYQDTWTPADSSRGMYTEPNSDLRGRQNAYLGSLYNYYKYIKRVDMTQEKYKYLAQVYVRQMPDELSNDFPVAATLLYTPSEAKDNYTKTYTYSETGSRREFENYSATLSGSAKIQTESNVNYVRTTVGTEIATNHFDFSSTGAVSLRVRTNGTAKIEIRRLQNSYAPKVVLEIPDTKGEWVNVTYNLSETNYSKGAITYYKILGDATQVDLDYIDFAPMVTSPVLKSLTCLTSGTVYDKDGETSILVPSGMLSRFQVIPDMEGARVSISSTLADLVVDAGTGIISWNPLGNELDQEYTVSVMMEKSGCVSVRKIILKAYSSIDQIITEYSSQYHPDTAQYTESSKLTYETALLNLKNTKNKNMTEQTTAIGAFIKAANGLKGLVAAYDFETTKGTGIADNSGQDNLLALYKNATTVSDNNSNVLYLDGSVGTYAELPQGSLDHMDEMTISFDVKAKNVTGNYFTFTIGADNQNYMYVKTLNEQIDGRITDSNASESGISAGITACQDKWMNITVVFTKDTISIYRDKVLISKGNVDNEISGLGTDLKAYLGRSFFSADAYFQGYFDNVKVYNYAKTAQQVTGKNETISLNYVIGEGGIVDGSTTQVIAIGESGTPIHLTACEGYEFEGWSDGSTNAERQDSYMVKDLMVYARFSRIADSNSTVLAYDFENVGENDMVEDRTGNGNFGLLYQNAVCLKDEEKNSNVLYLDGSTGTYAELPKGVFDGMDTMTITMDVKPVTVSGNYFTFGIGAGTDKYYFLKIMDTKLRSAITKSSYGSEQAVQPTIASCNNKWIALSVVITPTSMSLHKDGVLLEKKSDMTVSMTDLGSNLMAYLGKSFYSGDNYFAGYFDNIKVYNYALSDAILTGSEKQNVTVHYQAQYGGRINGKVSQTIPYGNDGAPVTAVADTGYEFVQWSDGNTNETREDKALSNDIIVTAIFKRTGVTEAEGLVADYEMSYGSGGKLINKASNQGKLDAYLVGITINDFIKDGNDMVLNMTGDTSKYVQLPINLVGDDETFSIETSFQTSTKANHWLFTLGSVVNGTNYIFLNPMQGDGKLRLGIKNSTTEQLLDNKGKGITEGEYNTVTATFDRGILSLYLNGALVSTKDTGYSIREILAKSTDGGVIGYLGKSLYAADPAFTGRIKSFKVFDFPMTAETVAARYSGTEKEVWRDLKGAKLTTEAFSFDKNTVNQSDVAVELEWNDASTISNIKNAGVSIGKEFYVVSDNTITIKKEYLKTQETGSLALTIEFDLGSPAALTIEISDTTPIATSTPIPEITPGPTIKPTPATTATPTPVPAISEADTGKEVLNVGVKKVSGNVIYKVTKAAGRNPIVEVISLKSKTAKSALVPDVIKLNGVTYKVTSIAKSAFKNNTKLTKVTIGKNVTNINKEAFSGAKKLRVINIKTTKLTSIGSSAFKGIKGDVTITVPKSKYKAYKKLLTGKGLKAKVKIIGKKF